MTNKRTLVEGETIRVWIAPSKQWARSHGYRDDGLDFYVAALGNLRRFVRGVTLDPEIVEFHYVWPTLQPSDWNERWPTPIHRELVEMGAESGTSEVEIVDYR